MYTMRGHVFVLICLVAMCLKYGESLDLEPNRVADESAHHSVVVGLDTSSSGHSSHGSRNLSWHGRLKLLRKKGKRGDVMAKKKRARGRGGGQMNMKRERSRRGQMKQMTMMKKNNKNKAMKKNKNNKMKNKSNSMKSMKNKKQMMRKSGFNGNGGTNRLQPKIEIIESHPARKGWGSISLAEGSPWCQGKPTYWLEGHQKESERPWCEVSPGKWEQSKTTVLDIQDQQNRRDGNNKAIDRHECTLMDVNNDKLPDIICGVGADSGRGRGFNELYLTNPDGSLKKITNHGLDKHPYMRNRHAVTLYGKNKKSEAFVFFATKGVARSDSASNVHRMYQNVYKSDNKKPWFKEVKGPWTTLFEASCAVAGDLNGDGRDDLIVCDQYGKALVVRQKAGAKWSKIWIPNTSYMRNWRNARIIDVTGDGVKDVVVVQDASPARLLIFKGRRGKPFNSIDFRRPYFSASLPHAAPDVEAIDANGDGIVDLYVVQTNEKSGYCGPGDANRWWGGSVQPNAKWVPPRDKAHDFLFVGQRRGAKPFRRVTMKHSLPGCGYLAERFGKQGDTMILSQGDTGHAGYNLLLRW